MLSMPRASKFSQVIVVFYWSSRQVIINNNRAFTQTYKTCTQIYNCSTEFAKFIAWEWTGVSDHRLDLEKLLGKSD